MVALKPTALLAIAGAQLVLATDLFTITSLNYQQPGGLDRNDPHMTFSFQVGNQDKYVVCDSTYKAGSEPTGTTFFPCLTNNYSWNYKQYKGISNLTLQVKFSDSASGGNVVQVGATPQLKGFDQNVGYACRDQGVCILYNKKPIKVSN